MVLAVLYCRWFARVAGWNPTALHCTAGVCVHCRVAKTVAVCTCMSACRNVCVAASALLTPEPYLIPAHLTSSLPARWWYSHTVRCVHGLLICECAVDAVPSHTALYAMWQVSARLVHPVSRAHTANRRACRCISLHVAACRSLVSSNVSWPTTHNRPDGAVRAFPRTIQRTEQYEQQQSIVRDVV